MTTRLTKPVARQTAIEIKDGGKPRTLIVTLRPGNPAFMEMRLFGRRQVETVDLSNLYFSTIRNRKWYADMERRKVRAALQKFAALRRAKR